MALSFSKEYALYKKKLAEKHELYQSLGMSQEQIDALDEFDKEEFLSNNTYKRHNHSLTIVADLDIPEDMHPLFKRFGDVLTTEIRQSHRDDYPWLDEIESSALLKKILSLPQEDLDLLNAYVFEGNKQKEIASKLKVSQKTISKRLKRIAGKLGVKK